MLQDAYFLYVEDDSMSREVMSLIMETIIETDRFTIFEDSENFSDRLRSLPDRPDVILVDIQIEPHDGFELLKMIRAEADYKGTPVIALTASVMNEQVKELRQAGFDGAIGKPISVATFPDSLERICLGDEVWHIS